jgi:TonB family protein
MIKLAPAYAIKLVFLIAVLFPAVGLPTNVEVISAAAPSYPRVDGVAQGKGEVRVEIEIDLSGKVTRAKAVSGSTSLRSVAEAAAREWQFKATSRKTTKWTITFRFIIRADLAGPPAVGTLFTPPDRVDIIAMQGEAVNIVDPPVYQVKPGKVPKNPR